MEDKDTIVPNPYHRQNCRLVPFIGQTGYEANRCAKCLEAARQEERRRIGEWLEKEVPYSKTFWWDKVEVLKKGELPEGA